MNEYNYTSFPLDMQTQDFENFPSFAKAGDKAPDGDLVDARTGRTVRLSDYWSEGPAMIEFGSIT